MVRLALDFSRHPLVDGQGNFGSVDGDPGCLPLHRGRVGMSRMAVEMLTDIEKDTIDWDPTLTRPRRSQRAALPLPNLLVGGGQALQSAWPPTSRPTT